MVVVVVVKLVVAVVVVVVVRVVVVVAAVVAPLALALGEGVEGAGVGVRVGVGGVGVVAVVVVSLLLASFRLCQRSQLRLAIQDRGLEGANGSCREWEGDRGLMVIAPGLAETEPCKPISILLQDRADPRSLILCGRAPSR